MFCGSVHKSQDKRFLLGEPDESSAAKGHDPGGEVKGKNLSLGQKVTLSAQQFGNEASCNFGDLYNVPTLQTLGMPLNLVSLTGICGGPLTFALVLVLGWFCDKGANPRLRRGVAFVLSTVLLVTGLVFIILANALHLADIHAIADQGLNNSSAVPHLLSSNSSGKGGTNSKVTFKAGLGMLGFVLTGMGVTCTHFSINSWVLSSSPRTEHTSVLVHGLIMASLGGVSTAALGMFDLSSAFRLDLADGAGLVLQVSVQAGVIVLLTVIGVSITLWIGHQIYRSHVLRTSTSDVISSTDSDHQSDQSCRTEDISTNVSDREDVSHKDAQVHSGQTLVTDGNYGADPSAIIQDCASSPEKVVRYINSKTSSKTYGTQDSANTIASNQTVADGPSDAITLTSVTNLQRTTSHSWLLARCGLTDFRWRVGSVCLSAYFSIGVIYMVGLMSSDYVGKAIYQGDPMAQPGSVSAQNYEVGVRMASWGFLVYYCVYLVFNPFHECVLARLGYKGEFVPIHLLMSGCLALLAVTARLEVYFLLSALAGLHRACFYSIPFAMANDIVQAEAEKNHTSGVARVGFAMSLVSGMIPLAFSTLFPWVGPLEQLTGVLAVPMWCGAAFACLSALIFLTV